MQRMKMPPRPLGIAAAASAVLLAVFLVMWPLGRGRYTSLGIDTAWVEGTRLRYAYYRLRWPGDGSCWLGRECRVKPYGGGAVDRLDLGGRFLHPPRAAQPESGWNRAGFWWINRHEAAPEPVSGPSRVESALWVGAPDGLLVALTAVPPLIWAVRRQRRSRGKPAA